MMYILTREQIEEMVKSGKVDEDTLRVNVAVTGWSLSDLMNTVLEDDDKLGDHVNWCPTIANPEIFEMVSSEVQDRASRVDSSFMNEELTEIAEDYKELWVRAVK